MVSIYFSLEEERLPYNRGRKSREDISIFYLWREQELPKGTSGPVLKLLCHQPNKDKGNNFLPMS